MANEILLEPRDGKLIVDQAESLEVTVEEVRQWLETPGETEMGEALEGLLDSAQGAVYSSRVRERWIVIHVIAD